MIVEPDFLDHWKTRLLITKTGDASAPLMILRLWAHCQQRRKWKFDITPETIAAICHTDIDPERLIHVLIESKFLRNEAGTLVVHDWEKANRSLVSAWKNGIKGGRPLKLPQNRQDTDRIPTANRSGTHPSNLSSLSNHKNGEIEGKDFVASLASDPTYEGIDVRREFGKMSNWCKVHKKQPTRARFVNWLNRAEKPITASAFGGNKQNRINRLNERKAELNRLPKDEMGNLVDRDAGRELQRINMELKDL
jgi:hypothetical protein